MANPVSKMTPAQKAWAKDLGALVATAGVAAPAKAADESIAASGGNRNTDDELQGAATTGEKKALFGGLIPFIPDIIPDAVTSKITIKNESKSALRLALGSAKVETKPAGFVKAPPVDIPANKDREFSVSNSLVGKVPAPVGTGGQVEYDVIGDAKKTRLFMQWERGFVLPSRTTIQRVTPKDEDKFTLEGANTGGEDFVFIFSSKGGDSPVTPPGPGPAPVSQDVPSSCRITVTNNTQQPLALAEQDHERGAFMTFPAKTVPAGGNTTFISVETPNNKDAKDEGCKGFVVWEIGSPAVATWRIEWDNPEGEKNTAKSTLTPQNAGFKALAQISQGEENVPADFTLSGGGAGPGPGPGPGPEPGPELQPDFIPPPESKQPTLRKGDKSKDGWVEYLQALLNQKLGINLEPDGNFGGATLKAVIDFQTKNKLQVDGTVGNQTWAALREATPEAPSSDGRKPHTFVEEGVEARWSLESDINNRYLSASDELQLAVDSVGDTPIDPATEATVRVTPPGAKSKVVKVKIGPPQERALKAAAGHFHIVKLPKFKKTFPPTDPKAKMTDYLIEAFLPQELGGDLYKGKVREG